MGEMEKPRDPECVPSQTGAEILPVVYEGLCQFAARQLSHELDRRNREATELVHEAWLRVAGGGDHRWENQKHFFAAATTAIQRILIESARHERCLKHYGDQQCARAEMRDIAAPLPDPDLSTLNEAVADLNSVDPPSAKLVQLRFVDGLTQAEAAKVLHISRSSADRLWAFARAWLFQRLRDEQRSGRV